MVQRRTILAAMILAVTVGPLPVLASMPGFESGPSFTAAAPLGDWPGLWHDGKIVALETSLRRNLDTENPHPAAAMILMRVLDKRADKQADIPARAKDMAATWRLYHSEDYAALKTAFPATRVEGITDPMALLYLAFAFSDGDMDVLSNRVALRLAKIAPNFYGGVWRSSGKHYLKTARQDIAAASDLAGGNAGKAIDFMRQEYPMTDSGRLPVIKAFLSAQPSDFRAWRHQAHILAELGHLEEALASYEKADELFPFYSNADNRVEMLARLQRFDEAKRLAEILSTRNARPGDQHAGALLLAKGLRKAGELGRARQLLAPLLEAGNPPFDLLLEAAEIEKKADRYQDALAHVAQARALQPAQSRAFELQMQSLGALERYDAVYAAMASRRDTNYWISQASHYQQFKAMEALDKGAEAADWLALLGGSEDSDPWMRRNYAARIFDGGDSLTAWKALTALVEESNPGLWYLNKLRDIAAEAGLEEEFAGYLQTLEKAWPVSEGYWRFKANQAQGKEAKFAVWQQAVEAAPHLAFPIKRAGAVLRGKKFAGIGDALPYINSAIAAAENGGVMQPSVLAELIGERAWYQDEAIHSGVLTDRSLLEKAEQDYKLAYDLNYDRKALVSGLFYVFSRQGRHQEQLPLLAEMLVHDPDSTRWTQYFVQPLSRLAPSSTSFMQLNRWWERRPRDKDRLQRVVNRHLRWGGSPVVALKRLQEMKNFYPDRDVDQNRKEALSDLGIHKDYYLSRYDQASSISTSLRYIGWFETARENAQKDGAILKSMDLDNYGVTVIRPDGIELERRYHPISGRITFLRVGAASMALAYSDHMELTRLDMGDENLLQMDYAASPNDPGQRDLVRVRLHDGRGFTINKQADSLIETWNVFGKGSLEVTRDVNGDVVSTRILDLEKGAAEFEVGSTISAVMDRVRSVTNLVQQGGYSMSGALPLQDADLDSLSDKLEASYDSRDDSAWRQHALNKAWYLSDRLADHQDYAYTSESLAEEVFWSARDDGGDSQALAAMRLWYKVNLVLRPNGLPVHLFETWSRMQDWLDQTAPGNSKLAKQAIAFEAERRKRPLTLLDGQNWLDRSYLSNDGYWRLYRQSAVFPMAISDGLQRRKILHRQNGDVLVSSNRGLAVLRRGYWRWLAWDTVQGRFTLNLDYADLDGQSDIADMIEDESGRLWIARGKELLILNQDYETAPKTWTDSAGEDVFLAPVSALAAAGPVIIVGTESGVWRVTDDGVKMPLQDMPGDLDVAAIRVLPDWTRNEETDGDPANRHWQVFIASQNAGAWYLPLDSKAKRETGPGRAIFDGLVTDFHMQPYSQRLMAIQGNKVLVTAFSGQDDEELSWYPLGGQQNILQSGKIFGFTDIELTGDDYGMVPVVMTDLGLSLYRHWHFNHLDIPKSDRQQPVFDGVSAHGNVYLLTGDGVAVLERGQVKHHRQGRVRDMVAAPDGKTVWMVNGGGLYEINADDPDANLSWRDGINADHLAIGPDGHLYTHDGFNILRYQSGQKGADILFEARPKGRNPNSVSGILPASDGSVWVTAGDAVFRHKDGQTMVHSMYDQQGPGRKLNSDMLANVIQTHDGRIWIVASNEGHRIGNGASMRGGIFEWDGQKFIKPSEYETSGTGSWFLTGYTQLDDNSAIVGTTAGMALHQGSRMQSFSNRQDVSYLALKDRVSALYVGQNGTKAGDNFWLFPTAGGIVARINGQWMWPSRLNKMLPDQHLANYGARSIHAIASDYHGRIYAGTDRGVMVYDPQGAGAEAFLIAEGQTNLVSNAREQGKLREVSSRLLNQVDSRSPSGKLAKRIQKLTLEIEESRALLLEAEAANSVASGAKSTGNGDDQKGDKSKTRQAVDSGKLKKALRKKEKQQLGLIAKLERNHPAMFQMLQINPLDIRALQQSLDPGVVLVQYLPTPDQLYINLVSQDSVDLRKVAVKSEDVMRNAALVSRSLAGQVRGLSLRGGAETTPDANATRNATESADLDGDVVDLVFEEMSASELAATQRSSKSARHARDVTQLDRNQSLQALQWLYDMLLRPVEHDLKNHEKVYIIPAGALNYLPFAALVQNLDDPNAPEYAVQQFDMAVLPTLYTWDLIRRKDPSTAFSSVIYGDSDGTLPAARIEAREIADILGGEDVELRIGEDAALDGLEELVVEARYLHLAVHGKLDQAEPEKSWLKMAGNQRLGLTDAMLLDLRETELVFLSACETGVGKDGLEFRTLAQAFAHAGAPSVVASLWEVHDDATRELATGFYQSLADENGIPQSLAEAQRAMIAKGGDLAHPAAWAGFLLFGGK